VCIRALVECLRVASGRQAVHAAPGACIWLVFLAVPDAGQLGMRACCVPLPAPIVCFTLRDGHPWFYRRPAPALPPKRQHSIKLRLRQLRCGWQRWRKSCERCAELGACCVLAGCSSLLRG